MYRNHEQLHYSCSHYIFVDKDTLGESYHDDSIHTQHYWKSRLGCESEDAVIIVYQGNSTPSNRIMITSERMSERVIYNYYTGKDANHKCTRALVSDSMYTAATARRSSSGPTMKIQFISNNDYMYEHANVVAALNIEVILWGDKLPNISLRVSNDFIDYRVMPDRDYIHDPDPPRKRDLGFSGMFSKNGGLSRSELETERQKVRNRAASTFNPHDHKTESETYKVVHEEIHGHSLRRWANYFKDYYHTHTGIAVVDDTHMSRFCIHEYGAIVFLLSNMVQMPDRMVDQLALVTDISRALTESGIIEPVEYKGENEDGRIYANRGLSMREMVLLTNKSFCITLDFYNAPPKILSYIGLHRFGFDDTEARQMRFERCFKDRRTGEWSRTVNKRASASDYITYHDKRRNNYENHQEIPERMPCDYSPYQRLHNQRKKTEVKKKRNTDQISGSKFKGIKNDLAKLRVHFEEDEHEAFGDP